MSQSEYELGIMGLKFTTTTAGTLLAGFLGSIISLKFIGPMRWYERVFLVVCGVICVHYFAPSVAQYFSRYSGEELPLQTAGFGVGLFAMSLVRAVQMALYNLGANPMDLLRLIFNRGKQ